MKKKLTTLIFSTLAMSLVLGQKDSVVDEVVFDDIGIESGGNSESFSQFIPETPSVSQVKENVVVDAVKSKEAISTSVSQPSENHNEANKVVEVQYSEKPSPIPEPAYTPESSHDVILGKDYTQSSDQIIDYKPNEKPTYYNGPNKYLVKHDDKRTEFDYGSKESAKQKPSHNGYKKKESDRSYPTYRHSEHSYQSYEVHHY